MEPCAAERRAGAGGAWRSGASLVQPSGRGAAQRAGGAWRSWASLVEPAEQGAAQQAELGGASERSEPGGAGPSAAGGAEQSDAQRSGRSSEPQPGAAGRAEPGAAGREERVSGTAGAAGAILVELSRPQAERSAGGRAGGLAGAERCGRMEQRLALRAELSGVWRSGASERSRRSPAQRSEWWSERGRAGEAWRSSGAERVGGTARSRQAEQASCAERAARAEWAKSCRSP